MAATYLIYTPEVLLARGPNNQIQRLVLLNYLHGQLMSHRAKLERLSLFVQKMYRWNRSG
jgi:hypothetical protein